MAKIGVYELATAATFCPISEHDSGALRKINYTKDGSFFFTPAMTRDRVPSMFNPSNHQEFIPPISSDHRVYYKKYWSEAMRFAQSKKEPRNRKCVFSFDNELNG